MKPVMHSFWCAPPKRRAKLHPSTVLAEPSNGPTCSKQKKISSMRSNSDLRRDNGEPSNGLTC